LKVLERKLKVAPDDVFREKEMNNEVPKQENKPAEAQQNETFGQNNFVGWGGAILSLLGVVLAMGDTTIQNEIFAISSFVAGAALSFISLQFKPLWIAFVSLGISSVAFFFLMSILGLM